MASSLRRHAIAIFKAALRAADPEEAIHRHLMRQGDVLVAGRKRYSLPRFERVYVLGAGKAGASMARSVAGILGVRLTAGFVNVPAVHAGRLRRIELNAAGHPIPDGSGVEGARHIAQIASQAGPRDLVVCVISGGASAMLPFPAPGVTLGDKQQITKLLLDCGATIHEINCIRKHVSLLKGGGLARLAYPATVLALILSDVIGDDLDVIGSGPTVPDHTTFADARAILKKYGIWKQVPAAIRERLSSAVQETPKPGDPIFARVQNLIVGSNRLAVDAAALEARSRGFRTVVLSTSIEGEAREVARVYAAIAKEIRAVRRPVRPPACIISGGETTVTIRAGGLGGRNQEFALAAAIDIAGLSDVLILSAGTDGADGPTDAAGAIADGATIARAQRRGLDARRFLANNDSYSFLSALGGLITTGPTGTNVADVQIILVG